MQRKKWLIVLALLFAAAVIRVAVAHYFANDGPDDGRVYAQIARNVLEQHVYSHADQPPYEPSLIRLPGYPLFLAAIYAVFGHANNGAVRIVQALIDTATCGLIGLLAFYWQPDEKRKFVTALAALIIAAICPFTMIYAATILTEVPTMFLAVAMCLAATLAFRNTFTTEGTEKAQRKPGEFRQALLWWCVAGLLGGMAVLLRPDSGLFAAAIGFTLVLSCLFRFRERWRATLIAASVFSLAFILVLGPWTIRNARVFHLFQPLAPTHGEMPGEFVPRGYNLWLRTWLDDEVFIGPFLWSLDTDQIKLDQIPPQAFDSEGEKNRVAALLEKYNHPPDSESASTTDAATDQPQPQPSPTPEDQTGDESEQGDKNDQADESDNGDKDNEDESAQPPEPGSVEMTPEIDAGFAQIARERIARHPVRYYLWLPVKRAGTMWLNTHSQYWPWDGELFPLDDLDHDTHQQYWLPLFAALTWVYTLLGLAGGWILWRSRKFAARRWLLLAALVIFLRLAFFSTMENPEPRYVVEFFPFLALLGGIAMTRFWPIQSTLKIFSSRQDDKVSSE